MMLPDLEYQFIKRYTGNVRAVIFDWAGTVVDCGALAPVQSFLTVFNKQEVPITEEEVRNAMGTHKKEHIKSILNLVSVRERWHHQFGRYPNESDVEILYEDFQETILGNLSKHSHVIPGVASTVKLLRKEGIKIGSCTGYTISMIEKLKVLADAEGYTPDCYVASDQVPAARPCPHMIWLNAIQMNVYPIEAIVKVDDTVDGIKEGLAAGCWTVGIAKTGNYVGLSLSELEKAEPAFLEEKLVKAQNTLAECGAHFVIDEITQLPQIIQMINQKLKNREKP